MLHPKKVGTLPVGGSDKEKQKNAHYHFTVKRNQKTLFEDITYDFNDASKAPDLASAKQVLQDNRGHWSIENKCHYIIDWNYDEDRSRISKGYGPENMTRLRRFAVGIIKSKNAPNVAQKMRSLTHNIRVVFDYLKMTRNTCASQ